MGSSDGRVGMHNLSDDGLAQRLVMRFKSAFGTSGRTAYDDRVVVLTEKGNCPHGRFGCLPYPRKED